MLKFEIPMFYTLVFYIEGNKKQIEKQINSIMKNYELLSKGEKEYKGFKNIDDDEMKSINGRTVFLLRDPESTLNIGNISKSSIICFNTESRQTEMKSLDQMKCKISTISHEIRHVVDKLVSCHKINDIETPAYLTGWLTGEILDAVLKKD